MASITLFSIYLLYKYFADKMYYFVTGYFFLLGVAAVTGKFSWPRSDFLKLSVLKSFTLAVFEPLIAPKLTFIFPLLCPDADYQLTFKENKVTKTEKSKKKLFTERTIRFEIHSKIIGSRRRRGRLWRSLLVQSALGSK